MFDHNNQDKDEHEEEQSKILPSEQETNNIYTSPQYANLQSNDGQNELYRDNSIFFNYPFDMNHDFSDFSDNSDMFFDEDAEVQNTNVPINYSQNQNFNISADTENAQNQSNISQSTFDIQYDQTRDLSSNLDYIQAQSFNMHTNSEIAVNQNFNSTSIFGSLNLNQLPALENITNQLILGHTKEIDKEESQEMHLHENEPKNSILAGSTKSRKRKVELNDDADAFKDGFYKIFIQKKKKFPKKLVKKIHNKICTVLNMNKMRREYERRIDLYFQVYSPYAYTILTYLYQHKDELLEEIPELQNFN